MNLKARNILLLLGVVICAGLLLGMTFGKLSPPTMIDRGTGDPLPSAARADSGAIDPASDAARESPYAALSVRPDLDYDREVWPGGSDSYRYDPDYRPGDDPGMRRAYRREYGRDFFWPDIEPLPDLAEDRGRSASSQDAKLADSQVPSRQPGAPSSRYADIAKAPGRTTAEPKPGTPQPTVSDAGEPRAVDGPLPAIW